MSCIIVQCICRVCLGDVVGQPLPQLLQTLVGEKRSDSTIIVMRRFQKFIFDTKSLVNDSYRFEKI